MALSVLPVEYFHVRVWARPGEAYQVLSQLAASGVNLLAFSAIPSGGDKTDLMVFPEEPEALVRFASRSGLILTGPQRALLIRGDDRLGVLADIHGKLADAKVSVFSSSGVTDGKGGFGYVVYVKAEDFEKAARALGI